jgi:hypothetical protein
MRDQNRVRTEFPGVGNKQLRLLIDKLRTIILTRVEPDPEVALVAELKPERYSDALLRSLLEFVGIGDIEVTPLGIRFQNILFLLWFP